MKKSRIWDMCKGAAFFSAAFAFSLVPRFGIPALDNVLEDKIGFPLVRYPEVYLANSGLTDIGFEMDLNKDKKDDTYLSTNAHIKTKRPYFKIEFDPSRDSESYEHFNFLVETYASGVPRILNFNYRNENASIEREFFATLYNKKLRVEKISCSPVENEISCVEFVVNGVFATNEGREYCQGIEQFSKPFILDSAIYADEDGKVIEVRLKGWNTNKKRALFDDEGGYALQICDNIPEWYGFNCETVTTSKFDEPLTLDNLPVMFPH